MIHWQIVDGPTTCASEAWVRFIETNFCFFTNDHSPTGLDQHTRRRFYRGPLPLGSFHDPLQRPIVDPWGSYLDVLTWNPLFWSIGSYIKDSNPRVKLYFSLQIHKLLHLNIKKSFITRIITLDSLIQIQGRVKSREFFRVILRSFLVFL